MTIAFNGNFNYNYGNFGFHPMFTLPDYLFKLPPVSFNYSLGTNYQDSKLSNEKYEFVYNNYVPYKSTSLDSSLKSYSLDYSPSTTKYPTLSVEPYVAPKKTKVSLKPVGLEAYSAEKGERLAKEAKNGAVGFTGYCAKSTKNAIVRASLGKYKAGHAFQCDTILDENPNFKQISTKGLNLDKDLPAGCVLVYEKGVAGYSSEYGHIEITDGKGNAYSDGKTTNIRPGAKVYIPVDSTGYYA